MVKFYFIYLNLLHILDEKTTEIKLLNIMKVGFSLFTKSSFFLHRKCGLVRIGVKGISFGKT